MLDTLIYLKLVGGFALLMVGGETLVRSAVALARRLRVSPLLIGATVIAFGTSLPELVVTLQAALRDSPGIAYGNVIGSNIANLLLILGMTAVISPVAPRRKAVMRDALALVGATLLLVVFVAFERIVAWQGAVMLLLLGALTFLSYRHERRQLGESTILHQRDVEELNPHTLPVWLASGLALVGLGAVAGGAHLLVAAATVIARGIGISETVIGLTVVAVGTSLPELATTCVAAYRKHADVALGNVLGSSLFNILAILGAVTVVTPLRAPAEVMSFDIWVLLGVTLLIMGLTLSGLRLGRPAGVALLSGYGVYCAVQYLGA